MSENTTDSESAQDTADDQQERVSPEELEQWVEIEREASKKLGIGTTGIIGIIGMAQISYLGIEGSNPNVTIFLLLFAGATLMGVWLIVYSEKLGKMMFGDDDD